MCPAQEVAINRSKRQTLMKTRKFSVVTLGCSKNSVETEFLKSSLKTCGYEEVDEEDAEIIVVNTCGFIQAAKEESIETILHLAMYKEEGRCRLLIVAGCMAQRYHQELHAELPEIDGVIGLSHHKDLPFFVSEAEKGKKPCVAGGLPLVFREERHRADAKGPSAYMQISDGCDNFCAYCAIPSIRGRYRSRPIESLLKEARYLIGGGVREIVLIGQDTAFYGGDFNGKSQIDRLLTKLGDLDELAWIRLLYCQPQHITEQFIELVATNNKVCPYLDIPFQHASKRVLANMNRSGCGDEYLELISRIRSEIPGIALRTSMIIGFPGETEKDFEELLQFIEAAGMDYVGLFEYSREENTASAVMPDQIPDEVVRERFRIVSDLRDGLALARCRSMVGKNKQVLIESMIDDEQADGSCFQGRAIDQAPEIDGEVQLKGDGNCLTIGDIIEVKLNQADFYHFEGEPIV